jgi:hypothetical protein
MKNEKNNSKRNFKNDFLKYLLKRKKDINKDNGIKNN